MFERQLPAVFGLLLPLVIWQCARQPAPQPLQAPPPAARVPSVVEPSRSESPPAASSESVASPPRVDPLPPPADLTDPAAKEKFAFASTVCAVALRGSGPKLEIGCRECPPFEGKAAQPDGQVVRDPPAFFPLEFLVHGAFTRAGTDEAAAVFSGCESHAENWGGTLLAKRDGNAWRAVEYRSGVHPESCKPFRRPDGRDLLVCRWVDGHQSFWHDRLFSYDWAQPDGSEAAWRSIMELDDNTAGACFLGTTPGMEVTRGTIESFDFSDVDHDGHEELIVRVSHAKSSVGAAFRSWCARAVRALDKNAPMPPLGSAAGRTLKHQLVFELAGDAFVPDSASARLLSSFVPAGP